MSLPKLLDRRRGWLLAGLIGNGLAQAAAALGTALLVRAGFDLQLAGGGWHGPMPFYLGAGLLLCTGVFAWLRRRERIDAEVLGQSYIHAVRMRLFAHLSRLPPRVLQKRRRGALMLRFVGDLTALRQWVSLGLARLLVASVAVSAVVLAMLSVNLWIAATSAVILVCGALAALLLGRRMLGAVRLARSTRSRLAANVSEKINCMAVVQVYGQRRRESRRLALQSDALQHAMIGRARIAGSLRASIEATTGSATAATLLVGSWQVAQGQASTATVAAAMTLIGLLLPRLRDLGRVQEYWYGAQVANTKIEEFLAFGPRMSERRSHPDLRPSSGRIEFVDVAVTDALQPFSARVEAGRLVGLVGSNGAGKSTLLALTARLLDADAGHLLIDGQRIDRCNLPSLRANISLINPELPLLRGSLERNLRYRAPRASAAELERVIRLSGLESLIAELPDGLRTRIGEGGGNLSTGQRQRIAIARALVGNPRILLLDEADANLDPRTAATLDRVLATSQATVLMVSHRLERLVAADEIWHLERGQLQARGRPRDLLYGNGPTARLFAPQLAMAS